MSDSFFDELEKILRFAADEDEEPKESEEEEPADDASPEDEVIGDKELADEQRQKDETLPPLGEGDDLLDADTEEPFGPALTPSLWEQTTGQDGLLVFQKSDSESDPEATKGRYTRRMHMNVGEPDDAVVDYINAFLVHNKIKTTPLKHMTMRTPYGPSSIDEYDNGITVSRKWQDGKFTVAIQWKSDKIQTPPVFKKEVAVPDELKAPEEAPADDMSLDMGDEEIPDLGDLDEGLPGEAEGETAEGEEEPGKEEEEPEEEEPEEEKEASLSPRIRKYGRLSKRVRASEEDDLFEGLADLGEETPDKEPEEKEEPEETEPEKEEPEEKPEDEKEEKKEGPPGKDQVKEVHDVLDAPTESGKTVFEEFLEMAINNQWLYPRDFKDIQNMREAGKLDELRQKEEAMANAILGRLKGVIKQKQRELSARFSLSKRIFAEIGMPDSELIKLIADKIESVSSTPLGKTLSSDVRPDDIAEVPEVGMTEEPEAPEENPKSASERLVEEFFEEKGEMPAAVRQKINDIDLLNKIVERLEESGEFDEVTDDDLAKAKKIITYHQQGTGDLTGIK